MTNGVEKDEDKGFTFDSLDEIHDDIQDASPLPSEEAIAAHGEKTAATVKAADKFVDKKGVKFDAALHAVDSEGRPSVTPLGKFRKKRGISTVAAQSQAIVGEQKKAEARAAGKLCAEAMIGSCVMFLGPEWNPIGGKKVDQMEYDEREVLRNAFADYFEAKNFTDFPPGLAFGMILSSYAVPRFTAGKETKVRMKKARGWFAEKWANFQDKRSKKNAAQPDTRDNGKRENDTSKKAGDSEQEKGTGGDSPRPDV